MRIDSHIHGDPDELRGDPQAYVAACRERGIDAVVLIETAQRCLRAVEKFGDFVIPVARIAMDASGVREVEDAIQAGCRGIKFIRPAAPYGDERYWPLYGRLEELGAPAVFHTGYLGFRSREDHPARMEHMRAAQIDVIARRFPELKVLMAHFSNPWWEEAWKVCWSNKNVYADLSGGTAVNRSTRMWAEMFAPDDRLLESSIRKLCFGSDVHYFRDGAFPFERYIDFYERIFDRIRLSEELRETVNSENIQRLFGLAGPS
jgi:predicted TIM-barrel fold metal-dependent hydrolase